MDFPVLVIAALHSIPPILVALIFRKEIAVYIASQIAFLTSLLFGNDAYLAIDLAFVFFGAWTGILIIRVYSNSKKEGSSDRYAIKYYFPKLAVIALAAAIVGFIGYGSTLIYDEFVESGGFHKVEDGFLRDAYTGILWSMEDDVLTLDWHDATSRCGTFGQRLPSIKELTGIYNRSWAGQTKCGSYRCNVSRYFKLNGPWFWSSSKKGHDVAASIDLNSGKISYEAMGTRSINRALCVKDRE